MADLRQVDLEAAIRRASERVAPITIDEVTGAAARTPSGAPALTSIPTDDDQIEVLNMTEKMANRRPGLTPARAVWVAMAAAAVVAVAALAVGVGTTETDAVSEPRTAEDLARAYVDAVNARDANQIAQILAQDALVSETPKVTRDTYPDALAWYDTLDWRWTVTSCEVSGTSATCSYNGENAWSRALGFDSTETGEIRVTEVDGQIATLQHFLSMDRWQQPVVQPFRNWLSTNHPDAFEVMWPQGAGPTIDFGTESRQLFATLTEEFSAEHRG